VKSGFFLMAQSRDVTRLCVEGHFMKSTFTEAGGRVAAEPTQQMRDEIVDWLKDAYAMERGLEAALQKQSQEKELAPHVRERASIHLEETKRHAEEVRSCLQRLGTDTSALKTGLGTIGQSAKGMMTMFARDEHIKDLLDGYMMEHFEIASYTALEAAADRAGFTDVAEMCSRIIPDEKRMAQAIIDAIPQEVESHLFKEASESAR
jgi:ferritin-like metal-binding protein YciE